MSETRIPVNEEYKYGFHDEKKQYTNQILLKSVFTIRERD